MRRSLWRFFPLAVVAGLAFVVLVNAGLVYAALHSFPGKTGDEGFELSNHYDAVIERGQPRPHWAGRWQRGWMPRGGPR
jgi:hypothetical protein